jgi:hypothetical protein
VEVLDGVNTVELLVKEEEEFAEVVVLVGKECNTFAVPTVAPTATSTIVTPATRTQRDVDPFKTHRVRKIRRYRRCEENSKRSVAYLARRELNFFPEEIYRANKSDSWFCHRQFSFANVVDHLGSSPICL